jgi:hypothetical protein
VPDDAVLHESARQRVKASIGYAPKNLKGDIDKYPIEPKAAPVFPVRSQKAQTVGA